jgi:thymidine kinase
LIKSVIRKSVPKRGIEVICGSMFSGKTKLLIKKIKHFQDNNCNVKVFKPAIDIRYGNEKIVSHDKSEICAMPIKKSEDIITESKSSDIIAIDEAQFFDKDIIEVCKNLSEKKMVIIAGLDMDYLGNGFGPMPRLIKIANQTTKLHATCDICGGKAYHTYRKSTDDSKILLGEKDNYLALCKKCFNKNMKKDV